MFTIAKVFSALADMNGRSLVKVATGATVKALSRAKGTIIFRIAVISGKTATAASVLALSSVMILYSTVGLMVR